MYKKIPDISDLVKERYFNSKITEVEGKIPSISGLATNSALTAVENKITDASSLAKKTDYDTKFQDIGKRIISNKTKNLLVENELKKIKTFYLSYFKGKNYFAEDGTQNYLVFQPKNKYFKRTAAIGSGEYICF